MTFCFKTGKMRVFEPSKDDCGPHACNHMLLLADERAEESAAIVGGSSLCCTFPKNLYSRISLQLNKKGSIVVLKQNFFFQKNKYKNT